MKITICGRIANANKLVEIYHELKKLGMNHRCMKRCLRLQQVK